MRGVMNSTRMDLNRTLYITSCFICFVCLTFSGRTIFLNVRSARPASCLLASNTMSGLKIKIKPRKLNMTPKAAAKAKVTHHRLYGQRTNRESQNGSNRCNGHVSASFSQTEFIFKFEWYSCWKFVPERQHQ